MNPVLAKRVDHWKDVILLLVSRDFRGRYKHTKVGVMWSLGSPLMFLLIFYFLFQRVINLQIPHYASFAFTGIIVWNWTQSALLGAASSISANQGLVAQPGFPIAAMPVVAVASALLNMLIALPLLFFLAWLDGSQFTISLISLPIVIAAQFLFILSLSYIIAALNVGLRDIEQILPILLQLGYYVTPIFFSLANVPAEYHRFFLANPMTLILVAYRSVIMDGAWPEWSAIGGLALGSLILLTIGVRTFEQARYRFLEEL